MTKEPSGIEDSIARAYDKDFWFNPDFNLDISVDLDLFVDASKFVSEWYGSIACHFGYAPESDEIAEIHKSIFPRTYNSNYGFVACVLDEWNDRVIAADPSGSQAIRVSRRYAPRFAWLRAAASML